MKETHNAPCNTGRVGLSLVVGGYTHTHTHTHTGWQGVLVWVFLWLCEASFLSLWHENNLLIILNQLLHGSFNWANNRCAGEIISHNNNIKVLIMRLIRCTELLGGLDPEQCVLPVKTQVKWQVDDWESLKTREDFHPLVCVYAFLLTT